ncbi:TVP38/TMEM64 family protein [Corynebacterium heidelbergense]|uniref:TVP38/TMEM64 family membrane protein n=1 Tax=Corynebacterium heidelbergense TaxID=2055947 RepID=A0A364VAV5_9CORY|nr:TVP38/TMEM64 family protein [Corynebacterium heidelbergense]RAV33782.1 hypothetical protein CWC39_06635 [Corynebacterium heidelbergense]WCZ36541.1 TVP38/TMEM64 family inner membrane protein YdjZ [Corynebacterium heidelbergense]
MFPSLPRFQPPHLVALGALALLAIVAWFLPVPGVESIRSWVTRAGWWAPAAYVGLMVAFTQLPVPRTLWTIAAGLLFGSVWGSALALTGLLCSAALSLTGLRLVANRVIRSGASARGRWESVQQMVAERGWIAVLGLRMVPAVPFSILNYACAASRIPLGPFLVATLIGSAPNTIATVVATDTVTTGGDPWVLLLTAALAIVGANLAGREFLHWRRATAG